MDELAREQELPHLGLHPRALLFKGNRLQIADFGLLPLFWQPAGLLQAQVQPRYLAPEMLELQGSSKSDQYSLAVIYQEMLTGEPPFRGRHASLDAQVLSSRTSGRCRRPISRSWPGHSTPTRSGALPAARK